MEVGKQPFDRFNKAVLVSGVMDIARLRFEESEINVGHLPMSFIQPISLCLALLDKLLPVLPRTMSNWDVAR